MVTVKFGEKFNKPVALCLGFFDCLHKGHTALINKAKEKAEESGAEVALFTFSNNHFVFLGKNTKLLYSFNERLSLYADAGIDLVTAADFTEEFMSLSSEEFLNTLCSSLNITAVVCGFDYTCGSDRANARKVGACLAGHGIGLSVVEEVTAGGEKISSTLIRGLISDNKIEEANALLSQPYFVLGEVTAGRHVGSSIGFPTANLRVSSEKLLPQGVFAGYAEAYGKKYKAIINIGAKPTFGILNPTIEVHLIDFAKDLYGSALKVSLTKYIREITKFDSAEDLARRLKADREIALND